MARGAAASVRLSRRDGSNGLARCARCGSMDMVTPADAFCAYCKRKYRFCEEEGVLGTIVPIGGASAKGTGAVLAADTRAPSPPLLAHRTAGSHAGAGDVRPRLRAGGGSLSSQLTSNLGSHRAPSTGGSAGGEASTAQTGGGTPPCDAQSTTHAEFEPRAAARVGKTLASSASGAFVLELGGGGGCGGGGGAGSLSKRRSDATAQGSHAAKRSRLVEAEAEATPGEPAELSARKRGRTPSANAAADGGARTASAHGQGAHGELHQRASREAVEPASLPLVCWAQCDSCEAWRVTGKHDVSRWRVFSCATIGRACGGPDDAPPVVTGGARGCGDEAATAAAEAARRDGMRQKYEASVWPESELFFAALTPQVLLALGAVGVEEGGASTIAAAAVEAMDAAGGAAAAAAAKAVKMAAAGGVGASSGRGGSGGSEGEGEEGVEEESGGVRRDEASDGEQGEPSHEPSSPGPHSPGLAQLHSRSPAGSALATRPGFARVRQAENSPGCAHGSRQDSPREWQQQQQQETDSQPASDSQPQQQQAQQQQAQAQQAQQQQAMDGLGLSLQAALERFPAAALRTPRLRFEHLEYFDGASKHASSDPAAGAAGMARASRPLVRCVFTPSQSNSDNPLNAHTAKAAAEVSLPAARAAAAALPPVVNAAATDACLKSGGSLGATGFKAAESAAAPRADGGEALATAAMLTAGCTRRSEAAGEGVRAEGGKGSEEALSLALDASGWEEAIDMMLTVTDIQLLPDSESPHTPTEPSALLSKPAPPLKPTRAQSAEGAEDIAGGGAGLESLKSGGSGATGGGPCELALTIRSLQAQLEPLAAQTSAARSKLRDAALAERRAQSQPAVAHASALEAPALPDAKVLAPLVRPPTRAALSQPRERRLRQR
ncbi:hypothetical protein T492DRAFT_1106536 [Pavlovales sp. CCMP2436]|nr:hypothetical protein T492DRAFT_1106536 [Pavlovales sp. CCMP2436]